MKNELASAVTRVPGLRAARVEGPEEMITPATSEPMIAGYSWMKKPVSRWWWSTGFRARAWTSIRSSVGPGVGVFRVVVVNGVPFSVRVAAWWDSSSDIVMVRGESGILLLGYIWWVE